MARTWHHTDQSPSENRPWIIGHRGFTLTAPENSLAAFRAAIEAGAEGVELDFQRSADGVLFCAHDETPKRCIADCPKEFAETPWDQFTWDTLATWKLSPAEGQTVGDHTMPSLAEAVNLISPRAMPVLEQKSGRPEEVIQTLTSLSLTSPVVVQSFDWAFLIELDKMKGDLPIVCAALGQGIPRGEKILDLLHYDINLINWRYQDLNPIIVGAFRKKGFQVWTWSLNRECQFRSLHHIPVSAVTTDDPRQTARYLAPGNVA